MTDGVAVTPSTDSSKKTIDTDEVTRGGLTVHQQIIKLSLGADGASDTLVDSGQQTSANSLPVVLPSDQTVAVSAESLPLPTGAATAAKQPALGTAGTASSDVLTVQGIASMTALKVDGSGVTQPVSDGGNSLTVDGTVTANLAAGTNNIGDVDVLTLPALPAGTNNIGDVDVLTLPALAAGTNLVGRVNIEPQTSNGLSMSKTISAASTNATSVKSSAGQVYSIQAFNTNASARYIKLYNKASAPTVGTDTPVKTLLIPGNTTGAGFVIDWAMGLAFDTGIAFAITTGIADSDTGAVAASEIVINIDYK